MIIFTTGARSYVGKVAIKHLIEQGHTIIDYTRSKVSKGNDPSHIQVHGEADDFPRIVETMKKYKVDAVLNLAAQSSPYVGLSVPLETAKVNFMNVVTLLEAARMCEVKRVILFSSDCGAGSVGADVPVTQDVFPKPRTVYGVTKTACEYLSRTYNYNYGMSCITLRIPHIIGTVRVPFEVFTEILMSVVTGEKFVRKEGMDTPYTFLHLEDLAVAIEKALTVAPEKVSEWGVYNVSDYSTNMKELLETVKKYAPEFEYEVGPGYEKAEGGLEMLEWIQGPWICDETVRDLGWKPTYNLETGTQEFLSRWMKAKEEGTLPESSHIATE